MTSAPSRSPRCLPIAGALISLLSFSLAAQTRFKDPDTESWQESNITLPSTFDTEQLQSFDVSQGAALRYGIDPKTLSVGEDGVVRYVMVASSSSGALNVFYQGLRCQTGEVKTYGRWDNKASSWNTSTRDVWQPLSLSGATRPAMMLARAAICEGRTVTGNPQKILYVLKHGRPETR